MSTEHSHGFWVTNHLANPVLRPILHGPLGRRWGRRLAVLRYRGRRTGQMHELVVQYAREGDRVWIMPGAPERKQWWRNMRDPLAVDLWLAGRPFHGVATAVRDPSALASGLKVYTKVFPSAPAATVMVCVDLDASDSKAA